MWLVLESSNCRVLSLSTKRLFVLHQGTCTWVRWGGGEVLGGGATGRAKLLLNGLLLALIQSSSVTCVSFPQMCPFPVGALKLVLWCNETFIHSVLGGLGSWRGGRPPPWQNSDQYVSWFVPYVQLSVVLGLWAGGAEENKHGVMNSLLVNIALLLSLAWGGGGLN